MWPFFYNRINLFLYTHKMKKTSLVLLSIFGIALSGCWTQTQAPAEEPKQNTEVKEEVKQEQKEEKPLYETYYFWDEWATVYFEDEIWWKLYITPTTIKEETFLKSKNEFEDDITAWEHSKYVILWFLLDNQTSETKELYTHMMPNIMDSKWRSFPPQSDITMWMFVENAIQSLQVRPWIPVEWHIIYEVAKDAEWFYLQTANSKIMLQERPA